MHWMYKYLGMPWTKNYDCFKHFIQVQETEFGVKGLAEMASVPTLTQRQDAVDFALKDPQVTERWERVAEPKEGDAVIFGNGVMRFHIGTYIEADGGGVLHCGYGVGVQFTPMRVFKQHGTKHDAFLRYKGE